MQLTPTEQTRLFRRATQQGDCILYGGYLDEDGYGTFYFRRRTRRAHRVIYWAHHGDIPEGMMIHHICRNRRCINVAHLKLVTPKENVLFESNAFTAHNAAKTHCKNGHPFDRKYGGQRYCSICEAAKRKRLRAKWAAADTVGC